jgi:hypothetical protein
VSLNGGSYTGAILFTGFMYIGAAACLWFVRAWKIGDVEREGAMKRKETETGEPIGGADVSGDVKITPFLRRMVMWRKV